MNKRWFFALILPPIAIGLVLRNVMSRRPQRMAVFGNSLQLEISVSPDGKWLVAEDALTMELTPSTSAAFAPRLINLETGQRRLLPNGSLNFSRWTSLSQLAFSRISSQSAGVTFMNPETLRPSATFVFKRGEDLLSWSESKNDVWMLTRQKWLQFDARSGKLLKTRAFKADSSQSGLRLSGADISPNGQKAIVKFEKLKNSSVVLTQLWDLNLNKPIRRKMGISSWCWIGNNSYLDDEGLQRATKDDIGVYRLIDGNGTICYHLDQQNHLAIFINEKVEWFNVETGKFIEETQLPTLRFDSLSFSPDHATGYFSMSNGEIWRQRLK